MTKAHKINKTQSKFKMQTEYIKIKVLQIIHTIKWSKSWVLYWFIHSSKKDKNRLLVKLTTKYIDLKNYLTFKNVLQCNNTIIH